MLDKGEILLFGKQVYQLRVLLVEYQVRLADYVEKFLAGL